MENETATLRYCANEREAYWFILVGDELSRECANRYATFYGHNIGEHQAHGWASSPLTEKNMRNWFKRRLRRIAGNVPMSIRRVEHYDALKEYEESYDKPVYFYED